MVWEVQKCLAQGHFKHFTHHIRVFNSLSHFTSLIISHLRKTNLLMMILVVINLMMLEDWKSEDDDLFVIVSNHNLCWCFVMTSKARTRLGRAMSTCRISVRHRHAMIRVYTYWKCPNKKLCFFRLDMARTRLEHNLNTKPTLFHG